MDLSVCSSISGDIRRVLDPFLYEDQDGPLAVLTGKVIDPAQKKAKELIGR